MSVMSTKDRVLDAAIELVGTQGLRSLTHARVDERAGVPRGSTSNYFRTRKALLSGVIGRIEELEGVRSDVPFMPAATAEALIDQLCGLLEHVTGRNRIQTTARLVLFMEASHDTALREVISAARARMEAGLIVSMAALGSRDPIRAAAAVAACGEGLIMHRIARYDTTDPRPILELVIRAGLSIQDPARRNDTQPPAQLD